MDEQSAISNPKSAIRSFGLIAGNGRYPFEIVRGAREAGVEKIVVAAFENETEASLAELVDEIEWLRVGQLGKLVTVFKSRGIRHAVMAGQIAPKNLFDLRPDLKAVMLLAKLKERNAESIFKAIGDELAKAGTTLMDATTFMEKSLAQPGLIAGPKLSRQEEEDVKYGFRIAKEVSRLDIGQTVVVRKGTVLAVEAFEGTNAAIKRGGEQGKEEAVVVKVSKPNQDFRFDVPVIGALTMQTAAEAKVRVMAVEAGRTLLLEREKVCNLAAQARISIVGVAEQRAQG
jgi:DUF1009 family protein